MWSDQPYSASFFFPLFLLLLLRLLFSIFPCSKEDADELLKLRLSRSPGRRGDRASRTYGYVTVTLIQRVSVTQPRRLCIDNGTPGDSISRNAARSFHRDESSSCYDETKKKEKKKKRNKNVETRNTERKKIPDTCTHTYEPGSIA